MAKANIIKPSLASLTPPSGEAGTVITIKGSGFVDGNNIHGVFFGGVPTHDWSAEEGDEGHVLLHSNGKTLVGWKVLDDNTIMAIAPEGSDGQPALSGEQHVMVRTEGGVANFGNDPVESNSLPFTYTPAT